MTKFLACLVLCAIAKVCTSDAAVDTDGSENISKAHLTSGNKSGRNVAKNAQGPEQERRSNCRISEQDVEDAFRQCKKTLNDRQELENSLANQGRVIKLKDKKADPSVNRMRKSDPMVRSWETSHLPFDEVSQYLYKRYNLTKDEIQNDLPSIPINGDVGRANREACRRMSSNRNCDSNTCYRTADGRCNNLQNPTWGSAMTCQPRLLRANYLGCSDLRRSVVNNLPLPEPRTLSLNMHSHLNRPTNYVTHMYMAFGQLLDHDITLTPIATTIDNQAIECCPPQNQTHPQCRPILISARDPFYSQFNVRCINFVRSAICRTCNLGSRQQMNQVTSFIDASFVYGNSENETRSLRTNDGTGRLRVQRSSYGDMMPPSSNPDEDQCSFPETNEICFEAGDPRANQHNMLTSLHTMFLRFHNIIANSLRQINPRWNDERIFQESRKIVGAAMQVITYKEYLPITLGRDRMRDFGLWYGQWTRYNSRRNPTMLIEFTTAAFRFGHSLINSIIANNPLNATNGRRLLRDEFFQPFELNRGIIGPLMRGASNSPAQWFDRHLVPDVTNFLYRIRGDQTGLDLAAINIQRGRDHGIPTYIDMVYFCSDGNINIRQFYDLVRYGIMRREQVDVLQSNYRSVSDIDLWPGLLMEIPNDGAVVGPTGACVIGEQFRNLKFGDRFYFEHSNTNCGFSYQQLQELRRITLSLIMCWTERNIGNLPTNAMLFSSRDNPVIDCRNVRSIDLSAWRE